MGGWRGRDFTTEGTESTEGDEGLWGREGEVHHRGHGEHRGERDYGRGDDSPAEGAEDAEGGWVPAFAGTTVWSPSVYRSNDNLRCGRLPSIVAMTIYGVVAFRLS